LDKIECHSVVVHSIPAGVVVWMFLWRDGWDTTNPCFSAFLYSLNGLHNCAEKITAFLLKFIYLECSFIQCGIFWEYNSTCRMCYCV